MANETKIYLKELNTEKITADKTLDWLCELKFRPDGKYVCIIKVGDQGRLEISAKRECNSLSISVMFFHRYTEIEKWYFKDWLVFELAIKELDSSMVRHNSFVNGMINIVNTFKQNGNRYKMKKEDERYKDNEFIDIDQVYVASYYWEYKNVS